MYIVIYILKTNPDLCPSSLAQRTHIDNNKHEKEMIERFLNVIASQRFKHAAIQAHMGYMFIDRFYTCECWPSTLYL